MGIALYPDAVSPCEGVSSPPDRWDAGVIVTGTSWARWSVP